MITTGPVRPTMVHGYLVAFSNIKKHNSVADKKDMNRTESLVQKEKTAPED